MSQSIDLSIVVPLFNEEESVAPLLTEIESTYKHFGSSDSNWEVVLVDDGSTDDTYEVARRVADSAEIATKTIALQRNFGQTAAMQAGIDAAQGRLIATIDGDLQNDPSDIPMMIRHLEENDLDLLVGRRANRKDGVLLRKIPSWIANRLIARVTGVNVRDYGCSLKIYRADVIRDVKLMGEMHRFIPAWVASVTSPSRIGEVDVNHRARQFGTSKYGISRTIRVVLDLLSVLFFMKYRARPGHFFGTLGMFVGAVGVAMLSTVFVSKFGFGNDIGSRPMLLVGAFSLFTSVQLIAFGILAEMTSRIYHQSSNQSTYVVRKSHHNADRCQLIPFDSARRASA